MDLYAYLYEHGNLWNNVCANKFSSTNSIFFGFKIIEMSTD